MRQRKLKPFYVGVLLDPTAGSYIGDSALEAIKFAKKQKKDKAIILMFNGVPIRITKTSTVESICMEYNKECRFMCTP